MLLNSSDFAHRNILFYVHLLSIVCVGAAAITERVASSAVTASRAESNELKFRLRARVTSPIGEVCELRPLSLVPEFFRPRGVQDNAPIERIHDEGMVRHMFRETASVARLE